ncbi:hypothetical protein [Streptomyces sp. NBC_01497]|nr:hypothetical protein [Streptomyces sp. NBC_01497]
MSDGWSTGKDIHPQLRDDCDHLAATTVREARDQAVPEQKAGRWFSRRT